MPQRLLGEVFKVPLDGTGRRPGDGIQATIHWVGYCGGVPALVSICLGRASFEVRFPGAIRTTGGGHNSKAVHRAYAKHAEVTVPSLDDWEKDWLEKPKRRVQSKLLPTDFRSQSATITQSN